MSKLGVKLPQNLPIFFGDDKYLRLFHKTTNQMHNESYTVEAEYYDHFGTRAF
jgi:hypothetical protein